MINKLKNFILFIFLLSVITWSTFGLAEDTTFSNQGELVLEEALELTLYNSPNISLQELSVKKAEALARIASGSFNVNAEVGINNSESYMPLFDADGLRQEHQDPSLTDMVSESRSTNLSLGLSKPFRSGVSTSLAVTTTRVPDNAGHPLELTTNNTNVEFTVNVPLLKGAGRVSAAANETFAKLNHQASIVDFQHGVSATILLAIDAFWKYTASYWYLGEVKKSQKRVQDWINELNFTDKTINSYLEDKAGQIIDAQQAFDQAKVLLANTMGIQPGKLENLGPPKTNYETEWQNTIATPTKAMLKNFNSDLLQTSWLNEANEKRLDLKAARLRQEAARVLLEKARKDLLPSVDLTLSAGYNGFSQYGSLSDFMDSYYENNDDLNYMVGVTLSYPFGNDIARGNLDSNQVDYQQAIINTDEKVRSIYLEIKNNLNDIYGRMKKVVQLRETIQSYDEAFSSLIDDPDLEQNRSKIVSVLELEDKYLEISREQVNALADLLSAVAKAHFNTGTLVLIDEGRGEINLGSIYTLPTQ